MLDEDGGLNVKRGEGGGENWMKCLKRRWNGKKGGKTKKLKTGECWVKGVGVSGIVTNYAKKCYLEECWGACQTSMIVLFVKMLKKGNIKRN